jgi:hypothetical protein
MSSDFDFFVEDDDELFEFDCFEVNPLPKTTNPVIRSSEDYRTIYLKSVWWLRRRAIALAKANNRCEFVSGGERCPDRQKLQVHHLSYSRLFGELDSDLQALCRFHHVTVEMFKTKCPRCGGLMLPKMVDAEAFCNRHAFAISHSLASLSDFRKMLPDRCAICRDPNNQAIFAINKIETGQQLNQMLAALKEGKI